MTKQRFDATILIILVIALFLGAIMIAESGFELASDGSNYFAYLRSAVFDGDLDFHNEFNRFDQAFWDTYKPKETSTGHLSNVFSVGPALLWSPFYLLAHLIVTAGNLFGSVFIADGFSAPYILAVNFASLFYVAAGTLLIYLLCRKYYGRCPALTASVAIMLATFVTYYTVFQPYMSHAVSFFTVTLFIYYWDYTRPNRSPLQWALLGIFAGLMMLVRWQNGLFMIFPLCDSLVNYLNFFRERNFTQCFSLFQRNLLFLCMVVVGFLPQMAAWNIIYGAFLTIPQGTGFLRWSEPFWTEILFSSRHGLYSWTPVIYLSTIGWLFFFRRDRLFMVCGLISFIMMTYINSIVSDWWAGWGFGMRRYDGLLVMFALGSAALFDRTKKTSPSVSNALAIIVIVFFSSLNWFLMLKVDERSIHPGGPVAFNQVFNISDQGFYEHIGYPFSFPANIIFSIRYGLPPSRYDTLIGGYIDDPYFYGDTIAMDKESALLGDGWSGVKTLETISGRLADRIARVYIPIRSATDFEMSVYCFSVNSTQQTANVLINGLSAGKIKASPSWQIHTLKLSDTHLRAGLNILEFENDGTSGFAVNSIKFRRTEYLPDWK